MRRSTIQLIPQLRHASTLATKIEVQPICLGCRLASPCFSTTSQTRSSQTVFQRSLLHQIPQSRSYHTSLRRLQQTPASEQTDQANEEPSIKTLYDYFPTSLPNGPPPQGSFAIDLNTLRREFLQLQASAHPDKYPPELKSRAETLSSLINEAYNTLRDPLRRAQYILELRGIDVANDETAKVEDQGLLMEVMEAQEGIEEANAESDLEGIRAVNEEKLKASIAVLEEAFAKDDIETARREAVRLRYWYNIHDGISDWEPGKPVTLVH